MSGLESLSAPALVWIGVVVMLAGFVHGVVGFGFPMIAMPLLTLAIDHRSALLLVILPTLVVTAINMILGGSLRAAIARFWTMPPFMAAGSAIGTQVSIVAPPLPFVVLLALVILLFLNLERLGRANVAIVRDHPRASANLFALAAGFFESTVNVAGPALIIYFLLVGLDPKLLVQSMNFLFVVGKGTQLVSWSTFGGLGWTFWLGTLPWTLVALVPLAVGNRIRSRLPVATYMRWLRRFLAIMVVVLLGQVAFTVANAQAQPLDAPPLHAAAARGDVAAVLARLAAGDAVDARNAADETPLFVAAENGRLEAVRALLERGADLRARTSNGETVLHGAAIHGDANVVWLLLERGADANAVNADGEAPLAWAAGAGNGDAVHALVKRGARVNAQDRRGLAALHFAAAGGQTNVVAYLLANAADRRLRSADGKTARDLAEERGEAATARILSLP